ncbi:MAG: hypothetical protein IIB38_17380, partial [Candidatus Hydrogenedentes bacterium]|nr:hypothetical protein [Candidatus Hydrogenedentota bacterium]
MKPSIAERSVDKLVLMRDETEGTSEEDVPPRVGDLEESLMDAIEGDDRFGSGTPNCESDTGMYFSQMSGLAGRAAPASHDVLMPASREGEPAPIDPISFYEEGVGDVDGSMDTIPPIVPELEGQ